MAASSSTGVLLIATGSVLTTAGFLLSLTGLGAICGVPMILICIPIMIWGYMIKAKAREAKEDQLSERLLQTQAIASGVNICSKCRTPNHVNSPFCSACGQSFVPVNDSLRPVSAVDPAEAAHYGRQTSGSDLPVMIEDEDR